MASAEILIVGAGPTGLVLALELARRGTPVRIIEKSSGPGQASRAIAVHARTLEFYQQLGFAEEVIGKGIRMDALHIRSGGRTRATLEFQDMGTGLSPFPFALCFPQDDHERFLVEKLEAAGIMIEWGTELLSFEQAQDAVTVRLSRAGVEEEAKVAWLCGCDGAHSKVRQGAGLGFPGGTYQQLFYVADVKSSADAPNDMFAHFGANAFVLLMPVRSSGMQRLIGIVPEEVASRPKIDFEAIRASAEKLIGVTVKEVNWFSIYHVHHRVADHFRAGRCFVLGDAAHIHSPAGGQGMNTGVGDAVNLAWKLSHVVGGRADAAILDTYASERIAFARTLVKTTDTAFEAIAGQDLFNRILRTWILPNVIAVLTRFQPVRRLMFKVVSQIRIQYRKSDLSTGAAGNLAAGDRLPWLADLNNFSPLRSLDWQLHVYGRPAGGIIEAAKTLGLATHIFDWSTDAGKAGIIRDSSLLIRPDGYIGMVLAEQDAAGLERYVHAHGLRFQPAAALV